MSFEHTCMTGMNQPKSYSKSPLMFDVDVDFDSSVLVLADITQVKAITHKAFLKTARAFSKDPRSSSNTRIHDILELGVRVWVTSKATSSTSRTCCCLVRESRLIVNYSYS